jgi:hypothetical protein
MANGAAKFPELWSVYPKQVNKVKAEKEFVAALKRGASADEIIAGAKRYANDAERIARAQETGSERFTKDPANWLRESGWTNPYSSGAPVIDQAGNTVSYQSERRLARATRNTTTV